MKKKYYAPEMEEVEVESPVLLEGSVQTETEGTVDCSEEAEA
jgi:hypothetical protein